MQKRRKNLSLKILFLSGIFQRTVQPLSEAQRLKEKEDEVEDKKTLRCSGLFLFKRLIYGGQMRFLISRGLYQCHYRKSSGVLVQIRQKGRLLSQREKLTRRFCLAPITKKLNTPSLPLRVNLKMRERPML